MAAIFHSSVLTPLILPMHCHTSQIPRTHPTTITPRLALCLFSIPLWLSHSPLALTLTHSLSPTLTQSQSHTISLSLKLRIFHSHTRIFHYGR